MSYATKVRELLLRKENKFGMNLRQIAQAVRCREDYIRSVLHSMYEVYVDHWEQNDAGLWVQVFCVVDVPQDEPRPEKPPFSGGTESRVSAG